MFSNPKYKASEIKACPIDTSANFGIFDLKNFKLSKLKSCPALISKPKSDAKLAALIYSEIDRNPYFKGAANIEDRSNMNAVFLLENEAHATIFDTLWKEAGISGLPGHRSVGGYRASMYNALPIESVQVLVDVMQDFERKVTEMNF